MSINEIDPEKYYSMSRLHPVVREDFFGWCDKKFYKAIKFGVGEVKCTVTRNGVNNSPYQVKGADIIKFLADVKKEVAVRGFPEPKKRPKKVKRSIPKNSK